jgi:hypothetical protein
LESALGPGNEVDRMGILRLVALAYFVQPLQPKRPDRL